MCILHCTHIQLRETHHLYVVWFLVNSHISTAVMNTPTHTMCITQASHTRIQGVNTLRYAG